MDMRALRATARLATIADWLQSRLDDAESDLVTEAVANSAQLRTEVAWVRRLFKVAEDLPLVDPPALLRQRLREQFRGRVPTDPGRSVPQLAGELVFDSRRDRLELSVRDAGPDSEVVHLVWRTEVADVLVEARPGTDYVLLEGQVLLREATASPVFQVTATGPGCSVLDVGGDAFGRFQVRAPATVHTVRLSNDELAIVLPIDHIDPLGGATT